MSEGTDKLRGWAASNREQAAEGIKYFQLSAENAGEVPKAKLEHAVGAFLKALAEGWEEIADAFDAKGENPGRADL